jgi:glutaminyl-peptide cyclotransferase
MYMPAILPPHCPLVRRRIAAVVLLGALAACGGGDGEASLAPTRTVAANPAGEPPDPADGEDSSATVAALTYEVLATIPHDVDAFTQGLLLSADDRLFEATGYDSANPESSTTVREVDPETGAVLRSISLGRDYFGEGLALVDDRLIQLTWTEQLAFVYDLESFQQVGAFAYDGEGWGLCHDDTADRLVMSNGSATLTFRDPESFAPLGEVVVTRAGRPVERLNELECAEGAVWANVWQTDEILRIDPASGAVTGVLDLAGIIEPDPADANTNAVLNGIAYDAAADSYLVTGKLWPTMYEIHIDEPLA